MIKKIVFLLLLFLAGCDLYVEPTNIQYNINGEWKIINITATYSEDIKVINNDFYAISPFNVVSTDNEWLLVQNDTTEIQACYFYKIGYLWEFDYNRLVIKNDRGKILGYYYIGILGPYISLTDATTLIEIPGTYIIGISPSYGTSPATMMYITVPEFNFNLEGSDRSFDRLINQNITLTLVR